MVFLRVKHNEVVYEVEVEAGDTVDVLKVQMFSLTDVPLERMRLVLHGTPLADATPVSVLERCTVHMEVAAIEEATTIGDEMLQTTCTRVFLGESPVVQPAFHLRVKNRVFLVCYACAATCRSGHPEMLEERSKDALEHVMCRCPEIESGECLFRVRMNGREELYGPTRDRALSRLRELQQLIHSHTLRKKEEDMLRRFREIAVQVMQYEDMELQAICLSLIPVDELEQRITTSTDALPCVRDEMVRQLLWWFKNRFFRWVKEPPCDACDNPKTRRVSTCRPSPEESQWDARVVELYECPRCHKLIRFPRYNHVKKLMETRRGRCGEWAQAWMLVCRTLGYEARIVHDWTDHVWTEVFSESQQRWVHADPCEAAYDAPLSYEVGWGKELTFCIAFSGEEVVDVTGRYTRCLKDLDRSQVSETWLAQTLLQMDQERRRHLSPERQDVLNRRREREQEEWTGGRNDSLKATEQIPRISGCVP